MALVIRTNSITKKASTSNAQTGTSIVDASWESIDPNPDVHALFLHFNDTFFDGSLAGCEVRWSPKMTYCAGLCVYEGRGGLCSVRLSEPLLKFRPRKDLVETLLHEMIHAYLFVTARDRDHDGHGPQFQAHMNRINAATGANISIYHNFNDEVAFHRQHWWRCRGPCRDQPPYFGYVKRAMNRAPGPNDKWHHQHRLTCGGQFEKIKEPEDYSKKLAKAGATSPNDAQNSKKAKKPATDDRFPGQGHVLGEGAGGKMRRLEDYFLPVGKADAVKSKDPAAESDDSSRASCPVCQNFVDSAKINGHLDECLTKSMLDNEGGASF